MGTASPNTSWSESGAFLPVKSRNTVDDVVMFLLQTVPKWAVVLFCQQGEFDAILYVIQKGVCVCVCIVERAIDASMVPTNEAAAPHTDDLEIGAVASGSCN